MRTRRALLAVVVLTLLGTAGCGDDAPADDGAAPAPVVPGASGPVEPVGSGPVATPGAVAGSTPAPGQVPPAGPGAAPPPAGAGVSPPAGAGAATPGGAARPPRGSGGTTGRPAPAALRLSANGLGPYQEGVPQRKLASAGVLGKAATTAGCPDFTVAKGVGRFQTPTVVFYQGKLQYLTVTSAAVVTSGGARVGMTVAAVKARHPGGKQLDDWVGASAWFVPAGRHALLFRLAGDKVKSIEAGLAEPLQFRFTDGEGC